jgi:hypothetical protein
MGIKEQNSRNSKNRRQTKRAWLIVCEGRNKTETNYFGHFNKPTANVRILVHSSEDTDPKGMVKRAETLAAQNDIGSRPGDRIICLMDLDLSDEKARLISDLRVKHRNVEIMVSNPCFEIWFLLHFTDHPNRENISRNVKKQLERYVPNYTESMDILRKCSEIQTKYGEAIINAENLRIENERKNVLLLSADANPYTDVYLLMRDILAENGPPQINCD